MKKLLIGLCFVACLGLTACKDKESNKTPSNDPSPSKDVTPSNTPSPEVKEFSLVSDDLTGAIEYDQENNIYSINEPGNYTCSGVLESGRIVVKAGKVNINLNNVTLTSSSTAIFYEPESSKLTLTCVANTVNTVTTTSSSDSTIESGNNLAICGTGKLVVVNTGKHAIDASEITIKEAQLDVTANTKDAIHGKNVTIESGTFVLSAEDDCIQADLTKNGGKGVLTVTGGYFSFNKGATAMKAGTELNVSGCTVLKVDTVAKAVGASETVAINVTVNELK